MSNVLETLKQNYIFAVVRGKDETAGLEICKAAVEGGIKNLELTFSTPNAEKVIAELVELYKDDETVVVGAGTVMSVDLAKKATDAGAKFLVSPHFDADIAKFAVDNNVEYMPGCATTTEIVTAMKAGSNIIKLFPGGQLGAGFIKDIHGPIPEVELMPSGGVSLDNIKDWKDKGAVAVGVGSALSKDVATKGFESVTEIAKQFVEALN
ncbi:bifunctional 4-hydroxy-2-oxoglutarate aldolase/2-dehydro-3-deoxy-phosphogluconate aldolase [Aerococcaceae bacterium WGS1372]